MTAPDPIAIYYDDGAYRELLKTGPARPGQPQGLMGRQVAGKEFLDAYLEHGRWEQLLAVTRNDAAAALLLETCRQHPSSQSRRRKLRHVTEARFQRDFLDAPPVKLIYFPTPPDPRFAWARRVRSRHGFALCGVTHTLCSLRAVEVLRGLVVDPWEPYDRLICTSQAVTKMVTEVIDTFGGYLDERHGGKARTRIGLETIPLGVNTDRFRPATPEERKAERARLGIAEDEIVVLFVGRLSHHAKAHPFPMYHGLAEAAKETSAKVRLLLVGWSGSETLLKSFQSAAKEFAAGVRVDVLDGLNEQNRFGAWRAADIFCSLSDNIQETFGLVIVEAMASGLPVVASDWNGYRDLVVNGETGFLAPAQMVSGATTDLTSRLLFGELDYNHFLAESSQAASVDSMAVANAFRRLFQDSELRTKMGDAGRRRALDLFAWPKIIRRYEDLWEDQQEMLAGHASNPRTNPSNAPESYPPLETTFAVYPTSWLDERAQLQAAEDAGDRLNRVLKHPLTSLEPDSRATDERLLDKVLKSAAESCRILDLLAVLTGAGVSDQKARATIAWLLKYDLLRVPPELAQKP